MILVTGATGHIGNVLVRELVARGERVRVLVQPGDDITPLEGLEVERCTGDVLDMDSLKAAMADVEYVYHLAGMISLMPDQWEKLYQVNVVGTRNVIQACRECGVKRLVYTSSIHAIVPSPHGLATDETRPFDPAQAVGEYDRSKAMATLEVLEACRQGLDAVIVCPTGVIGPYDFRLSEMGSLLLDGWKHRRHIILDGAYDFVDVRDVVEGMRLACERGRAGEYYILSGERITIREIFQTVAEIKGELVDFVKIPIRLAKAAAHFAPFYYRMTKRKPRFTPYSLKTVLSNSHIRSEKARHELGYRPRSIRESIADTINWFLQNQHRIPALVKNEK
jgi:dihydroflavonol-4-reductase